MISFAIISGTPIVKVLGVLSLLLMIFQYVIVAQAVLSFFARNSKWYWWLHRITEPVVGLFRPLTRRFVNARFPLDLAPLCALLAVALVQEILRVVIVNLMYAAF